jgi:phospholipase C
MHASKFVKTAVVLAASLAITGFPMAPEAERVRRIKHLVVIVQENVTFDHYFATYPYAANPPGQPVFEPHPETPSVNGLTSGLIASNPNSTKPFRLDRSRLFLCNPSPYYPYEQRAYHRGLLDRFPESTGQIGTTNPLATLGLARA